MTAADAQRRLARYGPNSIPGKRRRPPWKILLQRFGDFMIMALLAAAVISGFIGEPKDTAAIILIVVLNAVIGVVQECRASRVT